MDYTFFPYVMIVVGFISQIIATALGVIIGMKISSKKNNKGQ